MKYPNWGYTNTHSPNYKGKFTYCDDRSDIDTSRRMICQMANSTVGDTAIIFGAPAEDGKPIEIGKYTHVGVIAVWIWEQVHWKNGDWANIDKCLSSPTKVCSVVYTDYEVTFIDERLPKLNNVSMPNLTFAPGFNLKWGNSKIQIRITDAFEKIGDPILQHIPILDPTPKDARQHHQPQVSKDCIYRLDHKYPRPKDDNGVRSIYHGLFTYYTAHSDLTTAMLAVQNNTTPGRFDTAIVFSTDADAKEFVAIGIYGDDAYCNQRWKWTDNSSRWSDGHWAEIKYTTRTSAPGSVEFIELNSTILFHERKGDVKRHVHVGLVIEPQIQKKNQPAEETVVKKRLTMPENAAEDIVSAMAIEEYRRQLKNFMDQINTLHGMRFKYGAFVKKSESNPGGCLNTGIGKVIGWDSSNNHYRVFFSDNLPFVGCDESCLERWMGEVPQHVREYNPSINTLHVDLKALRISIEK